PTAAPAVEPTNPAIADIVDFSAAVKSAGFLPYSHFDSIGAVAFAPAAANAPARASFPPAAATAAPSTACATR
ncbi:hypothetical protein, partial [Snodgrassella sp. ESL0253]|uniref:hypothetical protein n=1 Tax=Snodgrassella sp. ESL0253 TaxID=2705031 RepID=UPI001931423B